MKKVFSSVQIMLLSWTLLPFLIRVLSDDIAAPACVSYTVVNFLVSILYNLSVSEITVHLS